MRGFPRNAAPGGAAGAAAVVAGDAGARPARFGQHADRTTQLPRRAAGTLAATAGPTGLAGTGARIGPARVTKSCQIVAGSAPPVTPLVGELSSLPTQTPTTSSGVKPMNQASR